MSSIQHAEVLAKKHQTLQRLLDRAYAHRYPENEILALKKRKLMIKDELQRLAMTGWREERQHASLYG